MWTAFAVSSAGRGFTYVNGVHVGGRAPTGRSFAYVDGVHVSLVDGRSHM
jgi:hypothetical protein